MNETRQALERARRLAPPLDDPLERLVRYRQRRQRNQRLMAAIVALAVFAGATLGLAWALLRDRGPVPAGPPPASLGAKGTITTVVGTGEVGTDGAGGPATEAQLTSPEGLAFDAEGNLYISDSPNHRVLKVDPSGMLTVVAGTLTEAGFPSRGFSGDGGPATEAELDEPVGVAIGPDGALYIADVRNSRVRMVDRDGVITTVAGTGEEGFAGDGGPATEALLYWPGLLAFDGEGNLCITEGDLGIRIRMVDPGGVITTIAGTGEAGSSPDGTPAAEASLPNPFATGARGMAFDPAGILHFAGHGRVRTIDSEGLLQTVAGNGEEGEYAGDGTLATETALPGSPSHVAFDADGNLYFATATGHRVWMVDREGVITTVAGTGAAGYSGDEGPAIEAELNSITALAVGGDGNLYIGDSRNHVVRMVVL